MFPSTPDSEQCKLYDDYPNGRVFYQRPIRAFSERRRLFTTCATLAAASFLGLVVFNFWSHQPHIIGPEPVYVPVNPSPSPSANPVDVVQPVPILEPLPSNDTDPFDPSNYLKGPPTQKFRDNLRDEYNFITSWISAGWTNDVITYANLVYLGLITDRIPVLAMFTPSHIGGHVPPIAFGDVFDMHRLRKSLNRPVLEWREVKDLSNPETEIIGCWNTWESAQSNEHGPRTSVVPGILHLDISYTQTPGWTKLVPNYEHDQHSTFWSLATLAFPETRKAYLIPPLISPTFSASLPPDEHMLCYDYLYYVCAHQPSEYELDFSPAWRYAGQYFRWVPRLEALGETYVRRAMGITDGEPTPHWITIHVRHRDFANWCRGVPLEECFAPLPVIARRVQEVKDELLQRKGIDIKHVIMTSDEIEPAWWEDVAKNGWLRIDHSRTSELFGDWYPLLIDAVIQSNGIGFVANDLSTVSVVARRRVESWHDGVTRTVKWGTLDADDH